MISTIQSIDFDAASTLESYIKNKLSKLEQFSSNILDIQVYLKLEKNKNKDEGNKIVEIKVMVPQNTLVSSSQAKTFEEATNVCVEHLTRQLVKHKEKQRNV